jgi:shikimate dehydrogenase
MEAAKCLERLEGTASLAGSVNVISNEDGKLVGRNTDGRGALLSLEANGVPLDGRRILIVGYGGVARAVAFEIARTRRPGELIITGRDRAKASSLAGELGAFTRARAANPTDVEGADVMINATPVGMRPFANELPLPESAIDSGMTVFDLVYNPLETRLLQISSERGCKTINGLEMLLYQGALAFEIWTGLKPPLKEMRRAAMEGLS